MTHKDKQDVIAICNILADKMSDSGKVAVQQIIGAVEDMVENEPCEDCISRESVRQLICKNNDKYGYSDRFHEFTEECLQLSSITPKQKVGKWIKTYEPNDAEPCILWMCSKCQNAERGRRSKYCPNCGADMRESED